MLRPRWRARECPKCGHKLSLVESGDTLKMRFWSCSNPLCDYVESRLSFSGHHRLPAPFDEVLAFLENERNEALKNVAVIGMVSSWMLGGAGMGLRSSPR
jgi:ssDNA-binding Zn-finger/Zn-ribbon topoisomerase 1